MRRSILIITFVVLPSCVLVAATHQVSRELTNGDVQAAQHLMETQTGQAEELAFEEQVEVILAIQDAVLSAAPVNKGIPHGQPRELRDLIKLGYGLCYDRSRAIETMLRSRGFKTRHASIYSTAGAPITALALATPGTESHAVSEVKTQRGWMLVDSNNRWIGLKPDLSPVDLSELRKAPPPRWHPKVKGSPASIFQKPFTWVYGLYSRHGYFYPPYNPIPDVNWPEFMGNI